MNSLQVMEQFGKALQMFCQSLNDEQALEVAIIYPKYEANKAYKTGEMFTYGLNSVGDPQLYRVVQNHISQDDWKPDITAALYDAIGLNKSGYPIWSQPIGAHDAYNIGDIVDYKGALYESLIDGNTFSPEAYPAGWKEVE